MDKVYNARLVAIVAAYLAGNPYSIAEPITVADIAAHIDATNAKFLSHGHGFTIDDLGQCLDNLSPMDYAGLLVHWHLPDAALPPALEALERIESSLAAGMDVLAEWLWCI